MITRLPRPLVRRPDTGRITGSRVSPAELPSGALVGNVQRWQEPARSKVVGYFPTWRDNGASALGIAGFTLPGLADTVARAGAVLLYKPHYNHPSRRVTDPAMHERCATAEDLVVALAQGSSNPAPALDARHVAVSARFWGERGVVASEKVADLVPAGIRPTPPAVDGRAARRHETDDCALDLAASRRE